MGLTSLYSGQTATKKLHANYEQFIFSINRESREKRAERMRSSMTLLRLWIGRRTRGFGSCWARSFCRMAKKIPDTNVCVQLVFVGPLFLFSLIWMLPFLGAMAGLKLGMRASYCRIQIQVCCQLRGTAAMHRLGTSPCSRVGTARAMLQYATGLNLLVCINKEEDAWTLRYDDGGSSVFD